MAAVRGRIEPAPRRVRGFLGHELVFDTTSARYVWEVPYYPQYYIPLADVRAEFLRDENHAQKVQFGPSRTFSLVGDGQTYESAARVFDDGDGPVAGTGAVRVGPPELVRGRRADLGPSPQPVCPGRRAALAPPRHRRTRRRRAGRHSQSRAAVRNRFADKVLHRQDRHCLRASGAVQHRRRCVPTRV